eukprot:TRINITY_DN2035_c0_g1_i3.p1 TRINITY_DN2035_c0_g1~~TRINITY_DN2035_c0_g1_i3.p1  ORF type:complete len:579 (+),score=259.67 TRINITY_DN2035_c0_g1_i3:574-2310(+)
MITELLFETYAVPKLNFGIDGIFAYNHLMKINNLNEMEDGIIINSGNNTTHLLVIHNHQFQANKTLRLSIGGHHITEYLRELIQIKYPNLKNLITTPRLQEIKQKFLYVGDNYLDQLKQFHYLSPFVDKKQLIIQFPIPASQQSKENNQNSNELNELEKERKLQLRKQQGQRLSEMAQQRRQKQLEDQQSKLEELEDLRLQKKNYSAAQFKKLLEEYNHKNIGALDREIEALYANINWNKTIITQEDNVKYFGLLDIADENLNEEQLRQKRKQRTLKQIRHQKERAQLRKQTVKQENQEKILREQELREHNPTQWLADLQRRRTELLTNFERRRKTKESQKDRRGLQAKKRMRLLAEHGSNSISSKKKGSNANDNKDEDLFGLNDDDWNIYLEMAGEQDHFSRELIESEELELEEIDKKLADYWRCVATDGKSNNFIYNDYQILLGVERIRCPEILFQPNIAGYDQMGLIETLQTLIKQFDMKTQINLVNNIALVGGNAKLEGFEQRIRNDFQCLRPINTNVQIKTLQNPQLASWFGAANFALNNNNFLKTAILKQYYNENGIDRIKYKLHQASNIYY